MSGSSIITPSGIPESMEVANVALHLDFAGPLEDCMFLILIDTHSKWIEPFCTPSATSGVEAQDSLHKSQYS